MNTFHVTGEHAIQVANRISGTYLGEPRLQMWTSSAVWSFIRKHMDLVDEIMRALETQQDVPPIRVIAGADLQALEELKGKDFTSAVRLTRPKVQGRQFGSIAGDVIDVGNSAKREHAAADVTDLFLSTFDVKTESDMAMTAGATAQELTQVAHQVFDESVTVQLLDVCALAPEAMLEKYVDVRVPEEGPWNCRTEDADGNKTNIHKEIRALVNSEFPHMKDILADRNALCEAPSTSERFGRAGGAPWLIRSVQDYRSIVYTWNHEERILPITCRNMSFEETRRMQSEFASGNVVFAWRSFVAPGSNGGSPTLRLLMARPLKNTAFYDKDTSIVRKRQSKKRKAKFLLGKDLPPLPEEDVQGRMPKPKRQRTEKSDAIVVEFACKQCKGKRGVCRRRGQPGHLASQAEVV
eukprot:TRINITY_DN4314_c0_g2_i2.p2 TRINITY_DN4314_c0_g2~~TRINITY_DN4314_c0_g2_i2.p2  ORF type:complete len:410 (-),score=70.42 TRINITY_DN4314_c0_g2_i2:149-1378(-)